MNQQTSRKLPRTKAWMGMIKTILWSGVAVFVFVLMVVSAPARFQQLSTILPSATGLGELQPENVQALESIGLSVKFYAWYFTILEGLVALSFFVVGLVVYRSRKKDAYTWFVSIALMAFGQVLSPYLLAINHWPGVWKSISFFGLLLGIGSGVILFLTFPDGHFRPGWARWLALIWGGYIILAIFNPQIAPRPSIDPRTPEQMRMIVWLLVWLTICAGMQVLRYARYSNRVQRQQTKWVVFGISIAVVLSLLVGLPYLGSEYLRQPGPANSFYQFFAFTVILLGGLFFAISVGVALLRYRLYDIDTIIRKTLQYALLTGLLALAYFFTVILLQNLTENLFGEQSPLVIVLSTLVIAALFNPLRIRIQDFIDRRFYRKKYDAEQALAQFAATARDEVDIKKLSTALLVVIEESVQPEKISMWLLRSENE